MILPVLLVASALSTAGATTPVVDGREALDYGFRFASAIDPDPKDKAKAQQAVAMDYASLGLLDEAVRRADKIEGWRRLTTRANLAAQLAQAGRIDDARALVARVEADRQGLQGWEGPRVAAELAAAYAALGSIEPSTAIARDLAEGDARQYAARAVAIQAAAHGTKGEYDNAIALLRSLEGDADIEITWWRTTTYLDLSTKDALTETQRRSALDEARRSADGLAGWKRAQALIKISDRYREIEVPERAVEALDAAQQGIEALEPTDETRPVALAELARAWSASGETDRMRGALAAAESSVGSAMVIDRPALYAAVGSGWYAVGDATESRRLYDLSLDLAAKLQNARPRALAVVQICRALARSRATLDAATRERLDALLAGLEAPW